MCHAYSPGLDSATGSGLRRRLWSMKKIAGRGGHHQPPRVGGHTPAEIRLRDHQPKVEKGGRERKATMAAVVWRRSRAQLVEVARTGDLPLQIDASHCRDKE
jgi:hypothetical protein